MNGPSITPSPREPLALLALTLLALLASGIAPIDRTTWWLEVAPILIALPVLLATWQRFPLTPLLYRLAFLHALVLIAGGHYTYSQVPVGFWFQDLFDLGRNHYDRFGHLMQGFVPALIAREVLLRRSPLVPGKWLFFLVACVALAISASYELVEWGVAVVAGEGAVEFLGTQGDLWDSQWDMFLALIGAVAGQLLLGRVHDRELGDLVPTAGRGAPPAPARAGARRAGG